ncbi:uncharacterized protein PHACADRAFT_29989 [Phanerochaete carnosa HHB-10118-sp]|uniref:MIOS-like alpha-solenoid domain-containing protein n=1 Tax=Phanerochaete carnosa (strain HHB-10118-sp) TaxID=650164 RepID=K5WWN2_PHACS|nr:uncharacterized protein PHACADRAFT_29989 [Phanerochaete carnosa HHB-10118-sp]EKM54852.1 hypothetical protein PHACADRAFT_29989 [Phanerochaete carnosa HHB-10118-sp]
MVVQTEKRLIWHPRLDNKFLVGGSSQVTLYEWAAESSEIKHVTSKQDLNLMKCVAWSPDPAFDDLVAVGFGGGKVDLIRLETTRSARSQGLSSGPSVTLPVRNSRSCNALAFNSVDPNYLAVGLDKVRGDASLVVWDVVTANPALSVKSPTQLTFNLAPPGSLPRPQPIIPRGDVAPRTDPRVLQQLASTEVVTSVSFLPKSTHLLLAGISHRWLRLFDLRSPTPGVTTAASKVHGIATDPFDPHRIACYGDGVATIWDARRLSHPLLTFTEKDASADGARPRQSAILTCVEFSPVRRGLLATLEKEANHVRFWDLQQVELHAHRTPDRSRSRDSSHSTRAIRMSWVNPSNMLPWSNPGNTHVPVPPTPADTSNLPYQLVLSNTRRTEGFNKTLGSFAFVPSTGSYPLTSDVMVVNREGDLELYAVHDTPIHNPWSARGELALGIGRSYAFMPAFQESEPPLEPWEIDVAAPPRQQTPHSVDRQLLHDDISPRGRGQTTAPMFGKGDEDGFPALPCEDTGQPRSDTAAAHPRHGVAAKRVASSPSPARQDSVLKFASGKSQSSARKAKTPGLLWGKSPEVTMQHIIEGDISMIMRRRVTHGYGLLSPIHNYSLVVQDDPPDSALSQVWLWIHHIQSLLSAPPSALEGYNFSYQGVIGVWEGFRSSRSHMSAHQTPRISQRGLMLDIPPNPVSNLLLEQHHPRSRSRQGDGRRPKGGADTPHDEFSSAVSTLLSEKLPNHTSWKPAVNTNKLAQRQLALYMCAWSLAEEDLSHAVRRWEKEHRHTQAACWLVFTKQYHAAVEVLMRSKAATDEAHHMMSGMLAALAAFGSSGVRNVELRETCERLVVRLQDPYLRAILSHLTSTDDWDEVLGEDLLPLRERLAIALQFLNDKELTAYLRRVLDRCIHDGDIEGLIVSGLTSQGMDILQTFLDASADIQTVSLLTSLNPARAQEGRTERWLGAYRDLLDEWKLFHHRCQFDIDRGRILNDAIQSGEIQPFRFTPPQMILRCNYCNKHLTPPLPNNLRVRATSRYRLGTADKARRRPRAHIAGALCHGARYA